MNPSITTSGTGNAFRVLHWHECPDCNGIGSTESAQHRSAGSRYFSARCETCNGAGMIADDGCGCDDCSDAVDQHAMACGCGTCWACEVFRANQHGPITQKQWLDARMFDDVEPALRESVAFFADEAVAS